MHRVFRVRSFIIIFTVCVAAWYSTNVAHVSSGLSARVSEPYELMPSHSCLENVILSGEDPRFRAIRVSSSPRFWVSLLSGELAQSGHSFASLDFVEGNLDNLLRMALNDAPRNSIVLDCGANIGFLSLTAASLGFEAIAFEPIKLHREKIRASICLNSFSNIHIVSKGLSNQSMILRPVGFAEATQLRNISYDECVRLTAGSHLRKDSESDEGNCREKLPITTLDEELTQSDIDHVRFMKLDIEGHEIHALHGARKLLESSSLKFIHFEWSPHKFTKPVLTRWKFFIFCALIDLVVCSKRTP